MKEHFQVVQAPASEEAKRALQEWVGRLLPSSYVDFLRETNGAELGVHDGGGDCLCLWSAEQIPQLNAANQLQRWLPGTFAIGSDGGADAVLLDMTPSASPERWPVIRVGFGALDREEFCTQAGSFAEWADRAFRLVR